MSEKALVLLCKSLLTQCLLDELPVVIDFLVLLSHLCTLWIRLHSLVVCKEFGEHRRVETTSLLVNERRLHEHGVCTLLHDVLKLGVGNCQPQFLSLVGENGVAYKCVPHLILDLVEFLL